MSAPHFRNKHLVSNDRLHLSPNLQTKRRKPVPPAAASTIARWNFNAIVSGNPTTINARYERPPQAAPTIWTVTGITTQGNAFNLDIVWDQYLPFLEVTLSVEYGAGFITVRQVNMGTYAGRSPFDTGKLNWSGGAGTWQVWLQGQQN